MVNHVVGAGVLVLGSLLFGIGGHLYLEDHSWHEAFLNSTMMLGGIGPVILPKTSAGTLFVSFFGMYGGLLFVAIIGIILTPVIHRLQHRFHWGEED